MNDTITTYGQEFDPEAMREPGMEDQTGAEAMETTEASAGEAAAENPEGENDVDIPAEEGAEAAKDADGSTEGDGFESESPPADPPKKQRRRRAAVKEAPPEDEAPPDSDEPDMPPGAEEGEKGGEESIQGSGSEPEAESGPEPEPEPVDEPVLDAEEDVSAEGKQEMTRAERDRLNAERRRERMRIQRQNAVLDEAGRPIMDGDGTFEDEIAEIYRVKNTRQIVSGFIDEVKQGRGSSESYIESMYNGFRVLIPFSEMDVEIEHREDETDRDYQNRLFTTISNMLGAEIDFVVRDVSMEDRLAAGSRLQATKARRRDILNATDREGQYIVYEGRRCTARVLATHPTFAFLEVYGLRVRLRARDIRSEYVSDVTRELQAGESMTVYITHIERDKHGEVTEMFVSMRNDEAERRELERAAADLHVGDTCRGRVSSRSRKVIFIRLNNGVHAFCHVSNGLQGRSIPNVGDTVAVRIIRKMTNKSSGNPLIQGKIVRNLKFIAK